MLKRDREVLIIFWANLAQRQAKFKHFAELILQKKGKRSLREEKTLSYNLGCADQVGFMMAFLEGLLAEKKGKKKTKIFPFE